jgi:hypothetical protein
LPLLLFRLAKQTREGVSVSSIDEIDNPNKSFNPLYNTFQFWRAFMLSAFNGSGMQVVEWITLVLEEKGKIQGIVPHSLVI